MEKTFSRKLRNKYKNMDEFHNYRIPPPPPKKKGFPNKHSTLPAKMHPFFIVIVSKHTLKHTWLICSFNLH